MFHSSSHFVFWGFLLYFTSADDSTIVTISQGKLKGIELKSRNGRRYLGFFGIPYVDIPERFQAPTFLPPTPWEGVRDATTHGNICIQFHLEKQISEGEEDCLNVNVCTHTTNPEANLPVMVFIHGGGFQWGSGPSHGSGYLMDEDILFVSFNYRVGVFGKISITIKLFKEFRVRKRCFCKIFHVQEWKNSYAGFLSTGDIALPGNMGMKDQVVALQWVQRNIKAFGGNPEQVTIFGQSAGAAAIGLHVVSPMSKGLFSRAIMQSGGALSPFACLNNPKHNANEFAEQVNCTKGSSLELLKCLRAKTAEELLLPSLVKWHIDPTFPFAPVVEELLPNQTEAEVFLSKPPFQILSEGSFNKVPIIAGVVRDEGTLSFAFPILRDEKLQADMNNDWYNVAPITLAYYDGQNVSQSELNTISDAIRKFYFKDQPIGESTRKQLTDLYSDRLYMHGTRATAMEVAKHNVTVYVYIFAYQGHYGLVETLGSEKGHGIVTHADDLQYIFDGMDPDITSGSDLEMSRRLIKLWTTFAKTGTPIATWRKEKRCKPMSTLQATSKEKLKWCLIKEDTSVIEEPFSARMSFWDDLMLQHPVLSFPR